MENFQFSARSFHTNCRNLTYSDSTTSKIESHILEKTVCAFCFLFFWWVGGWVGEGGGERTANCFPAKPSVVFVFELRSRNCPHRSVQDLFSFEWLYDSSFLQKLSSA